MGLLLMPNEKLIKKILGLTEKLKAQYPHQPVVPYNFRYCEFHKTQEIKTDDSCVHCIEEELASVVGKRAAMTYHIHIKTAHGWVSKMCADAGDENLCSEK